MLMAFANIILQSVLNSKNIRSSAKPPYTDKRETLNTWALGTCGNCGKIFFRSCYF